MQNAYHPCLKKSTNHSYLIGATYIYSWCIYRDRVLALSTTQFQSLSSIYMYLLYHVYTYIYSKYNIYKYIQYIMYHWIIISSIPRKIILMPFRAFSLDLLCSPIHARWQKASVRPPRWPPARQGSTQNGLLIILLSHIYYLWITNQSTSLT